MSISSKILNTSIPINDFEIFKISHKILIVVSSGNKIKRNDFQIYLAIKRFHDEFPKLNDSNGLTLSEITSNFLDKLWAKTDDRLARSGKVHKIFNEQLVARQENIWRNPLGTQKGISCFAPLPIISQIAFVNQNRTVCPHRIVNNKCRFKPDTTCNPYNYPKLLQSKPVSERSYEYRITEWNVKLIKYLITHSRTNNVTKIPIIPLIVATYFGSNNEIRNSRESVTISDFKTEFNLSDKELSTIFELNLKNRFNKILKNLPEIEIISDTEIKKALSESEISEFPDIGGREKQTLKLKKRYYYADEIKREQAQEQHRRLISQFSKLLSNDLIKPKRKGRIDLFGIRDDKLVLFEMKSVTKDNERKQIRTAIGQLWDYEFLELENYRKTHKIFKVIVLERKPTDKIIDWLRYSRIFVYWLNENNEVEGEKESLDFLNKL